MFGATKNNGLARGSKMSQNNKLVLCDKITLEFQKKMESYILCRGITKFDWQNLKIPLIKYKCDLVLNLAPCQFTKICC